MGLTVWGSVSPFQTCRGCSDVSKHLCGSRRLRFQFSDLPSIPRGSPRQTCEHRPAGVAIHRTESGSSACTKGAGARPTWRSHCTFGFNSPNSFSTFCCHSEINSSSCELRAKRAWENLKEKKAKAWSCQACPPEPPRMWVYLGEDSHGAWLVWAPSLTSQSGGQKGVALLKPVTISQSPLRGGALEATDVFKESGDGATRIPRQVKAQ